MLAGFRARAYYPIVQKGKQGMASAPQATRIRVSRAGGLAFRRTQARGDARSWVGREAERLEMMRWLAGLGWSYAGIGRIVCLSRQRVQQLLGAA